MNKNIDQIIKDYEGQEDFTIAVVTIQFVSSQPLTELQLKYIQEQAELLMQKLPYEDQENMDDVPEWTTIPEVSQK